MNPNSPEAEPLIRDELEVARAKGVSLQILKARAEGNFETAFTTLVQLHAGAVVVGSDAFFFSRREQLVALAAGYAVPAIYDAREFVATGGLISYGSSFTGLWRQAGIYAGKGPQRRQGGRSADPATNAV